VLGCGLRGALYMKMAEMLPGRHVEREREKAGFQCELRGGVHECPCSSVQTRLLAFDRGK
jgi:hypothetical protein